MPGQVSAQQKANGKKRLSSAVDGGSKAKVSKKARTDTDDLLEHIAFLENRILESRKHFNDVRELLEIAQTAEASKNENVLASVALCRVFCKLTAAGNLGSTKGLPPNEVTIVNWLKAEYAKYVQLLLSLLVVEDDETQITALTLLMRLVKEEVSHSKSGGDQEWRQGTFSSIVRQLLVAVYSDHVYEEFVEKYLGEYDDVRFYTFDQAAAVLGKKQDLDAQQRTVRNALKLLTSVDEVPESNEELEDFYVEPPKQKKHPLLSVTAHKKRAQDGWLALFKNGLDKEQRKMVLSIMSHNVAPWFNKVELLMDFLTDSYDVGGATSLLALSGLFYLIQEKNLDYPQFYNKLYSLLDDNLLHSKHRSRFFRLLDTFMASTHLPAALVASFIKRLARLALHAPPAGIVAVVPWIYNMLKRHPSCTFMIHRVTRDPESQTELEAEGMDDPFAMTEMDPMETNAIESSLWEIVALQSHYHPNVATLAKIISEQFTKQSYNLEDFLDYSYDQLVDAELGMDLKKTPVIEYEIPKRILTADEGGLSLLGSLLNHAMAVDVDASVAR